MSEPTVVDDIQKHLSSGNLFLHITKARRAFLEMSADAARKKDSAYAEICLKAAGNLGEVAQSLQFITRLDGRAFHPSLPGFVVPAAAKKMALSIFTLGDVANVLYNIGGQDGDLYSERMKLFRKNLKRYANTLFGSSVALGKITDRHQIPFPSLEELSLPEKQIPRPYEIRLIP